MDRKEKVLHKFGKHLKALRKAKDLTTHELAAASGLGNRQILQIEAGEINLLFTTILSLSKGLDIPPDQLFESF
jgi:transcriptional regulator with XRE-family HTH domain